ncbi:unnamed protein product [Mytilus coruscus]|uniref:Reverse transcriptase domain-containing protein n=1 Tax=Mytilus coruscus TaxID=42192 RepID=A0A6J8E7U3_MYTCO|nr:unnamed protein product [Mytilus coruscus]
MSQSKLSWVKEDNDSLSRTLQEISSEMTTISINVLAMKTDMTGVNQNIDRLNDKIDRPVENGDEYCNKKHIQFKRNGNEAQLCQDLLDNPTSLAFFNDILDLMDSNTNDAANALISQLHNICTEAGLLLLNNSNSVRAVNQQEWLDSEYTFGQTHNTEYDLCIEEHCSYVDNDITCEYIVSEIKKLKNDKSPGEDGLSGEFYNCLSSTLLPVLLRLFKKIFHTGDFPECLSTAIITLFKKGGRKEIGNYRGMSLLCVISKIFMDDLALIADTPFVLQRRLNSLEKYCEKWNMTVNMDKSNTFKKGVKLSKNEKWYFENELLKVVSYYKRSLRLHINIPITTFLGNNMVSSKDESKECKYLLEKELLRDKTKIIYASKLSQTSFSCSQMSDIGVFEVEEQEDTNLAYLGHFHVEAGHYDTELKYFKLRKANYKSCFDIT